VVSVNAKMFPYQVGAKMPACPKYALMLSEEGRTSLLTSRECPTCVNTGALDSVIPNLREDSAQTISCRCIHYDNELSLEIDRS
jgi:hypothetical protein